MISNVDANVDDVVGAGDVAGVSRCCRVVDSKVVLLMVCCDR